MVFCVSKEWISFSQSGYTRATVRDGPLDITVSICLPGFGRGIGDAEGPSDAGGPSSAGGSVPLPLGTE